MPIIQSIEKLNITIPLSGALTATGTITKGQNPDKCVLFITYTSTQTALDRFPMRTVLPTISGTTVTITRLVGNINLSI